MKTLLALLLASTCIAGPLKVDGRWLKDDQGRVVILHGVNYSQRGKHAPYTSWQEPAHFDTIAGWGFNAVRYIVQWAAIEPKPGVIDEAYLDRVDAALGWAEERGIRVIVDMHQDVWAEVFGGNGAPAWATVDDLVSPNVIVSPWWKNYFTREVMASFGKFWKDAGWQSHYARAWQAVARRAAKHANVVGYDLMNEPFPGKRLPWTFEYGALSDFYAMLAGQLRAAHPGAIVFFEPVAMTANEGLPTAVKAPPAPAVYAPHYYDFLLMLGKPYKNRRWLTFKALGVMEKQAASRGVPLVLGEIGCDFKDVGALEAMSDQCDALDLHSAGWLAWEFTPDKGPDGPISQGGFSVLKQGVEHPGMQALVRPYARAVAGIPVLSDFDRPGGRFTFKYKAPLAGKTTEIVLPRRHFPAPRFEGTGSFAYDAATGVLKHTPDGAALQVVRVSGR